MLIIFWLALVSPGLVMSKATISTIPGTTCQTVTDCMSENIIDTNVICADEMCRCKPNYHWDETKQTCVLYSCTNHADCQEYDKFRFCLDVAGAPTPGKQCKCNAATMEAPDSLKCTQLISGDCKTHEDCHKTGDSNTVCIGTVCRCKVNYKYNIPAKKCDIVKCQNDLDCKSEVDQTRICNGSGVCVCKKHMQESPKDGLCYDEDYFGSTMHTTI